MSLIKKEFTVLCPNGRRVTIKSAASASIGQIIEEACLKQGYDPLNYNLRHLRRVLDPSNTIQYSNIPNRAQLELIEAEKRRQESNVTVNLVTEDGQRLIGDFPANATLGEILVLFESNPEYKFSLPVASSKCSPFVVYTMRKIIGDELETATLKSLGLYGGKCMMRYGLQQNTSEACSVPPTSPPIVVVNKPQGSATSSHKSDLATPEPMDHDVGVPLTEASSNIESSAECERPQVTDSYEYTPNIPDESEHGTIMELQKEVSKSNLKNAAESRSSECCDNKNEIKESSISLEETKMKENICAMKENVCTSKVIPLSDHHDSVLFSMDDAPPTVQANESDSFFDLTVNEVKKLYCEKVQQIRELEEAPLMTRHLRELEQDSQLLAAMNRHPITQLRIFFPDRHVIQANFKPRNTVREVMDFLRPFLICSDIKFYLYTMFPRKVLNPDDNLVKAECIPKARLYFGCEEETVSSFLSEETLSKKSTFEAAANSVIKSQIQSHSHHQESDSLDPPSSTLSGQLESQDTNRKQSTQKPKWFKLGK